MKKLIALVLFLKDTISKMRKIKFWENVTKIARNARGAPMKIIIIAKNVQILIPYIMIWEIVDQVALMEIISMKIPLKNANAQIILNVKHVI